MNSTNFNQNIENKSKVSENLCFIILYAGINFIIMPLTLQFFIKILTTFN